jgi:hypothetical protein
VGKKKGSGMMEFEEMDDWVRCWECDEKRNTTTPRLGFEDPIWGWGFMKM